jgi:hypothetical protein
MINIVQQTILLGLEMVLTTLPILPVNVLKALLISLAGNGYGLIATIQISEAFFDPRRTCLCVDRVYEAGLCVSRQFEGLRPPPGAA